MKILTCELNSQDTLNCRCLSNLQNSAEIERFKRRHFVSIFMALVFAFGLGLRAQASDHLDSPTTVANPQGDIGDIYAWTAPEGRRLNLVMTLQGHTFSDRIQYAIHIDSGRAFDQTTASTTIVCRFASATAVKCNVGKVDSASGDPSNPAGLEGRNHRFRLYAGLRDDPFYNNVLGLMASYQAAATAIKNGAAVDGTGCAHFDAPTVKKIVYEMGHTKDGPAQNLLYNWTVSAIVISVDLASVSKGGKLLAVWGTTSVAGKPLDRAALPFVKNTLLGISPFSTDDASGVRREEFNAALPFTSTKFIPDFEKTLAFQDSLDGNCGNQVLATAEETPARYRPLAKLFAENRLWVDTASNVCTEFFAVELAHLKGEKSMGKDCGGRSPTYDNSNMWRSLLIAGTTSGVTDGLQQDEHPPSATEFPFLAPPDPKGVNH